jgi:hypothetical protein
VVPVAPLVARVRLSVPGLSYDGALAVAILTDTVTGILSWRPGWV